MSHPIYRANAFEIGDPHALRVEFDDGTQQTIDFEEILRGELYGPLRNLSVLKMRSLGVPSYEGRGLYFAL
jgi:hypothetical protein